MAAAASALLLLLLLGSPVATTAAAAFDANRPRPKRSRRSVSSLSTHVERRIGPRSDTHSVPAERLRPPPRPSGVAMTSTSRASAASSSSSTNPDGETHDDKDNDAVRILALHGKGGTGPDFKSSLGPLAEALSDRLSGRRVSLDCPTAPFGLGGDGGGGGGFAWWTLPPGVRSFNAKEYIGFEDSASVVKDALLGEGGGYDLVLGHSQGAILLAALLARGDLTLPPEDDDGGGTCSDPRRRRTTRGYVLNGAAWPNPYSSQISSFRWGAQSTDGEDESLESPSPSPSPAPPRCLFVIGESDNMNPPEGARRVREALGVGGMDVDTVDHGGGHSVPVRDAEALASVVGWMAEALERDV